MRRCAWIRSAAWTGVGRATMRGKRGQRIAAIPAIYSAWANISALGPKAETSAKPAQASIAKATPKKVPHNVKARPISLGLANCAIIVGAATTMARCAAPSITRVRRNTGKGGNTDCTADIAAPVSKAHNKARR